MKISIIIPAWNLWEHTAACLKSLAEHTPKGAAQVIVADNGSSDETASQLADFGANLFGDDFLGLRLEKNLGFAKGCNAGAAKARGDMLFFLNNDTTVQANWLPPLLAAFSRPRTGACGPLLLYPNGNVQHCGISFDPCLSVGHLYQHFPGSHPLAAKNRPLQAITGAALMLPKNLFQSLGGFSEEYKNGFEDMDLCFKIISSGLRLSVEAASLIRHHESATPGRFAHDQENSRLLGSRWHGKIRPDLHIFARLDGYSLRLLPDLASRMEAGAERQKELEAANAGLAPDKLLSSLEEEPLWRNGWLLAIRAMDASGKPEMALEYGLRGLLFFPEKELVQPLLQIARKNPALEISRSVMPALAADLASMTAAPDAHAQAKRKTRARMALRGALKAGDMPLAALLEDWLKSNG